MTEMEKVEPAAPARRRWGILDPWFEDWMPGWAERWERLLTEGPGALRVEEFTEDDTAVVRVEAPGLDPEKDVEITVADGVLEIRAERREESRTEDKGRYRSEFRYGSFRRSVPLPAGASEEDVKATYKDGILEVRLPIDREAAPSRRVPIQRG